MARSKRISIDQTKKVGTKLKIDWKQVDLDEFRRGLEVELGTGRGTRRRTSPTMTWH